MRYEKYFQKYSGMHGRKHVTMVIEGNMSTTVVDEILTGIGHLPAVQDLDLEKAGVTPRQAYRLSISCAHATRELSRTAL